MSKYSFFISFFGCIGLLGGLVYAIQDTIQQTVIQDLFGSEITYNAVYPCFSGDIQSNIQLSTGASSILITEVGFDGSDEWIEITNITNQDIMDTFIISGAKLKPIVLTGLTLPAYTSFIIADSASTITGIDYTLTGQGLSLPDTTGFTLYLTDNNGFLYDTIHFDKTTVESIENYYSLDTILRVSDEQLHTQWYIPYGRNDHLFSGYFGTPGVVYCGNPDVGDNASQSGDVYDDDIQENDQQTGSIFDPDVIDGDTSSGGTNDQQSSTTGSLDLTGNSNTNPQNASGYSEETHSSATGSNISGNTVVDPLANHQLAYTGLCNISEIHPVSDVLPEYIEIYCHRYMSGEVIIVGLGTSTSIKKFHITLSTGQYLIITSSLSGFTYTGNITLLPGISLLDVGEELSIQWPTSFYTGLIYTGIVTYPALQKGESYYPVCAISGSVCMPKNIPTPGYDNYYTDAYYPYLPTKTIYQTINSASTTTTFSTSTYYQDLYKKRKDTAQTHEKTITELKKSLKSATNTGSTLANNKTPSTKSTKITPTSSTKPKSTTTKKTSLSSKTPTTPKKTPSSKKSTTTTKKSAITASSKSTIPKPKTVSTTSKAYLLLTNEHKLYKTYVDFLHTYLKSHLYTQYDSLQIPSVQSLLKKSLQTAKQNRTMISYSGGQEISIFDFSSQWKKTTSSNKNSLDIFAYKSYTILNKFVQGKSKFIYIPILTLYNNYFLGKTLPVDI